MKRVLGLLLVALFAGCSGGPPIHYYTLAAFPAQDGAADGGAPGRRIGVVPFRVEPPYDQNRLVYRTAPDSPRVEYYAYHQWAAPLGGEVASIAAAALAGAFPEHVVEVAAAARYYDAQVYGRVLALEEVDRATSITIRLVLDLELRSADGELLWVRRIEGSEEAASASVEDVVRMMRRGLRRAVGSVAGELAGAVPSRR